LELPGGERNMTISWAVGSNKRLWRTDRHLTTANTTLMHSIVGCNEAR